MYITALQFAGILFLLIIVTYMIGLIIKYINNLTREADKNIKPSSKCYAWINKRAKKYMNGNLSKCESYKLAVKDSQSIDSGAPCNKLKYQDDLFTSVPYESVIINACKS